MYQPSFFVLVYTSILVAYNLHVDLVPGGGGGGRDVAECFILICIGIQMKISIMI